MSKIVYKSATMIKERKNSFGDVTSSFTFVNAFALVVLKVDNDDILSDRKMRKEAYVTITNGASTRVIIDGVRYNRYNLNGKDETISPIDELNELDAFKLSYSSVYRYLHTVKCRCRRAKVLDIIDVRTGKTVSDDITVVSDFNREFEYTIGDIVEPTDEQDSLLDYRNPINICASGIHYFEHWWEAFIYGSSKYFMENVYDDLVDDYGIYRKSDHQFFKYDTRYSQTLTDYMMNQYERVYMEKIMI